VPRKPVRLKGLDQPLRAIEVVPDAELPPLPAAPKENRSLVTRRRFAAGATATLLLLSALVATVLARGGSAVEVSESSLAVIDPDTNEVVSSLPLSPGVGPVAAGEGGVWIANPADRAVLRVDSGGMRLVKSIGLGIAPKVVAAGQGGVWAVESNYGFAAVTRIDPKANEPRAKAEIDRAEGYRGDWAAFAAGAGALWLSIGEGHAYRLDPRTLDDPTRITGADASEIAVGAGGVWMVESADQTVTRVDPATNAVRAAVPIGAREPSALAVGAGSVWVTDLAEDKVWRIDAVRNSVVGTIPVGNGPTAVGAMDDAVWVANRFARSVSKIDPATNSVVATIPLGQEPLGIAAWNDKIWVTVA
jgi:YVTN family beta-propeller protein